MTRIPAPAHDPTAEIPDPLENEKILNEMKALEREGKLNEAAIAGFNARVDAQLARTSQAVEKAQADFEAAIELRKRPVLSKRFAIPAVVIFCWCLSVP